MWSSARDIVAGDVVIVWMTRENLQPLVVTPGKELNNKYGYYRHEDFIGVPYGSKVGARNKLGFVHLLRPTPELWTLSLPHRTQILYLADIAFVTSWLDIKPGSRVVEAGTGSGSFSHSTVRTIGPAGHLYSYEFHEARAAKAREEFTRHRLSNVTLTHRNVCKDGFTVTDTADAVFLDLPAPWDAVPHAKSALRKDSVTRICCFSPCIEQVLRTVSALNDAGFCDITTYESLLRPHDVSAPPLRPLPVSSISAKLRAAEVKREERRQAQIRNARIRNLAATARVAPADTPDAATADDAGVGAGEKRKQPAAGPAPPTIGTEDDAGMEAPAQKRARTASPSPADDAGAREGLVGAGQTVPMPSGSAAPSTNPVPPVVSASLAGRATGSQKGKARPHDAANGAAPNAADDGPRARMVLSKAFPEVRGHTSYLTFARLVPPHAPRGLGPAQPAGALPVELDASGGRLAVAVADASSTAGDASAESAAPPPPAQAPGTIAVGEAREVRMEVDEV